MRLFVSNIPYEVTADGLRDFFTAGGYETTMIRIAMETGRSRGFAFVEVAESVGLTAIQDLDGQKLGTRRVNVQKARRSALPLAPERAESREVRP